MSSSMTAAVAAEVGMAGKADFFSLNFEASNAIAAAEAPSNAALQDILASVRSIESMLGALSGAVLQMNDRIVKIERTVDKLSARP